MTTTTPCGSCGAPIVWARTETGRRIAIDPHPHPEGNLVLTGDGPLHTARSVGRVTHFGAQPIYRSHAGACRDAARHRRRDRNTIRRAKPTPTEPGPPVLFGER